MDRPPIREFSGPMKFIADVMLGRLAKRLRLLGHDVLYDRSFDDNTLIRISLEENRLILTRDRELARRPLAANHLFIRGNASAEQVREVISFLDRGSASEGQHPLTRCSVCNSTLEPLEKPDAKDMVPDHVFLTHDKFLRCAGCGRIYWRGTHTEKMGLTQGGRKDAKKTG
jgi:uncharacterized protein with PIN domain